MPASTRRCLWCTCRTVRSRSPGHVSSHRRGRAKGASWPPSSPRDTRASTSTTRRTGNVRVRSSALAQSSCQRSSDRGLRILPPDEGCESRDALLRRRLASLDLPESDDRRWRSRLGGDHRLAWVAARTRRDRRGSRPARRRARSARGRADRLGPLPRDAAKPGLGDPEGDRWDRERIAGSEGKGARNPRLRALRRPHTRRRRRVLVPLRHDPRPGVAGDEYRQARVVRRRGRTRPRGRRTRIQGVQDEHRRPGR